MKQTDNRGAEHKGARSPLTFQPPVQGKFIKSAADSGGFFRDGRPHIAVSGKSNVGKSSLINMLGGSKKLAKVSSAPGRTRLINYFDFGSYVLTDLPGYGFARAPKSEKAGWERLISAYLLGEELLRRVLMLVDIRHPPTELDIQLTQFFNSRRIPFLVVANKSDKIARSKIAAHKSVIASTLGMGTDDIVPVSSQTGAGMEELCKLIDQFIDLS